MVQDKSADNSGVNVDRSHALVADRLPRLGLPCAWLSANDFADCPMATAAAADTPAFSRLRRDTPAAQLHPSDVS